MGADFKACCKPVYSEQDELDTQDPTKDLAKSSFIQTQTAEKNIHVMTIEKKEFEEDIWDITDITKTYLGNNTVKRLYSKLFVETPQPEIILLLENDASPEIPGIYYKKQAPQYEGGEFTDTLFPKEPKSISFFKETYQVKISEDCYLYNIPEGNKKWLRPYEMSNKKTYFLYDTITVEDVHQGQLENIYFLNCLVSLASKGLIERVFDRTKSENGCYALKTYIQGKQKVVTIDDAFPCLKSKFFAFSYAGPNELWVPVIEKVWAKMNKSYAMTMIGSPCDPFYALCEAPCIEFNHKSLNNNIKKVTDVIFSAQEKGYLTFSSPIHDPQIEELGLFMNHTYNILKIQRYKNITLLQVKNQWGGYEWKGDYSDSSNLWTDELMIVFDMRLCEDGIFFISIEDYLRYFPKTFVLKYNEGWKYSFKKFRQTSIDKAIGIKLIVTESTKVFVTLHTKPERFNTKIKNYHPVMSRIFMAKPECGEETVNSKSYSYIGANSGVSEKLTIETDMLEIGEYHIFINSQWESFPEHDCPLVVSTYSEYTVALEELQQEIVPPDFVKQIVRSGIDSNIATNYYKNLFGNYDQLQIYVDEDNLKMGYLAVYLKNLTDAEITIDNYIVTYYEGKLSVVSRIEKKEPFSLDKIKSIEVKTHLSPGEVELHLFEIFDDFWNCNIKVKPPIYVNEQSTTRDAKIQQFFEDNLQDNCYKEKLNQHITYYEMETDEMIYLVFENTNFSNYKIRVKFNDLQNLCLCQTSQNSRIITVPRAGTNYINLIRESKENPVDFQVKFSLKCLQEK